jgi:uncharacterized membrane protein YgaE (UPF0421/DUF939 family)
LTPKKAIYLFPTKTVGAQLVGTVIGLSGATLGMLWLNLHLFVASILQSEPYDDDGGIGFKRRAYLWGMLTIGAFGCGFMRSRHPRSYLGIVFFMLVNMFGLIRGIAEFNLHQYFVYCRPMFLGACLSLVVSLVLWPEDRGTVLKNDLIKAIKATKDIVIQIQQRVQTGSCDELDLSELKAAESALGTSLHEANYEIYFCSIESSFLVPIYAPISRVISVCRVINSSMRRKQRAQIENAFNNRSFNMDTNNENTRAALNATFSEALEILDCIVCRIDDLYSNRLSVRLEHERYAATIENFMRSMGEDVTTRPVRRHRDIEAYSFTDHLNVAILDVFDLIKDIARTTVIVDRKQVPVVLPRVIFPTRIAHIQALSAAFRAGMHSDAASRFGGVKRAPTIMQEESYLEHLDRTNKLHRVGIFFANIIRSIGKSRHLKYGIKFMFAMTILALPAYISNWYIWYGKMRGQLAMVSAMVAMETTRGMTFLTAGKKMLGAFIGAIMAFIVAESSQRIIPVHIALSLIPSVIIACLVTDSTWAKTGTVCALAYNLILGVAVIFPQDGPVSGVFARRLITLPIGLIVAMIVHIMLFPYHSRKELVKGLGSCLDWLYHLVYTIEASTEPEYRSLQGKFDELATKAKGRMAYAKALLIPTLYEISLGGHWPYERFEIIVEKMFDVMEVVIGHSTAEPALWIEYENMAGPDGLRAVLVSLTLLPKQLKSQELNHIYSSPRFAVTFWCFHTPSEPDFICHAMATAPPARSMITLTRSSD